MPKALQSLLMGGALVFLAGCSTSRPLRIPDSERFDFGAGEYFLVLKSGKTVRVEGLKVRRDSVYFGEGVLPIREIAKVETRSFSPVRTLGLVAGIGAATVVAGSAYLYYLVAYGRASEK